MKKSLAFLILLIQLQSNAQQFNPAELKISWEIVENYHQNKSRFLSAFTFANIGKKEFPSTGWKIYFNQPRMIDSTTVSRAMNIRHRNGDLHEISPTALFKGLKPGDSIRIEFVASAWAINVTDDPNGIYIVWDNDPSSGRLLKNFQVKPSNRPGQFMQTPNDKVPLATPQLIYEQNKKVMDIPEEKLVKVFPSPAYYKETGEFFLLDENATGVTSETADGFEKEQEYLSNELSGLLGNRKGTPLRSIRLVRNNMKAEAYRLSVKKDGITIEAGSPAGIFYGIQSLKTLIPSHAIKQPQRSFLVPTVEIIDSPRFSHRAFLLDVARNFQSKEQVFKVLDLMALYKLNVFHFHLNDDEGWRLEIPGLPELTEVGSRRGHTLDNKNYLQPSFGSGPDVNSFGSGYYTVQDFVEILAYANARHIRVIPEIETPGHARAAIKSMWSRYYRLIREGKEKEASAFLLQHPEDRSVYRSVQRWSDNVMDVSMPSTYAFLEKVVDEIIKMYASAHAPLSMIHFGGDEVPAGVWERSPAAQKLMEENKAIKNTNDLWYYYFKRVREMLEKKGLLMYGWEEIGMRKTKLDNRNIYIPNPDFAGRNVYTDVWNNVIGWGAEDLPYRLANAGYQVILSPVSNMYFDLAYEKAQDEPGYYWGGYLDLDKPFYFIPFDYYKNSTRDISGNSINSNFFRYKERLTDYGKENIPGIQGLLWGETLKSRERLEYMMLPKLLALAERAWSPDPDWAMEKDSARSSQLYDLAWSRFLNVIGKRELPRLDRYAGGFQYRIPAPGAVIRDGQLLANMQMPGFVIRYTMNGSVPVASSPVYTGPLAVKGKITLRLFNRDGRGGRTVELQAN